MFVIGNYWRIIGDKEYDQFSPINIQLTYVTTNMPITI